MKFFCLIIYTILSSFSATHIKPKLCVECKFFQKNWFTNNKFGKCYLFPIVENDDYFLVNGIKNVKPSDYHYCSVSRLYDEMCGKDGKLYEKK